VGKSIVGGVYLVVVHIFHNIVEILKSKIMNFNKDFEINKLNGTWTYKVEDSIKYMFTINETDHFDENNNFRVKVIKFGNEKNKTNVHFNFYKVDNQLHFQSTIEGDGIVGADLFPKNQIKIYKVNRSFNTNETEPFITFNIQN